MNRFLFLVALLATAPFVQADWVIGSGRSSGMGRAGLALPGDFVYSGRTNPAMYGLAPADFRFLVPRFSFRFDGVGLGDLQDFRSSINQGGLDSGDMAELAKKFGDNNFQFGGGVGLGIFFQGLAIDFGGDALVAGLPNAELQSWVQGGSQGAVPMDAQLDAYGLGGYEFGIGYGRRLNTPGIMDISLGVRAKIVRSYYTHRYVDSAAIQSNSEGSLGSEMGGKNVLNESGLGLDLGMVASANKDRGYFLGATIENFLIPTTTFDATTPMLANSIVRPYARTVNFGFGYITPGKFVFAADFIDALNGGDRKELRVGSEYLMGNLAFRGGYESRSGFTVGFGIGGFNMAFGGNSSGQFSYALRF
ncbi:MAG: conjugal transfer protein TraF [Fimbriimonadaceae bacterium]|nr:conjugal transfer protein TraF [Fimbriimonadaceae bacterium]